jgi:hypothetical protein
MDVASSRRPLACRRYFSTFRPTTFHIFSIRLEMAQRNSAETRAGSARRSAYRNPPTGLKRSFDTGFVSRRAVAGRELVSMYRQSHLFGSEPGMQVR